MEDRNAPVTKGDLDDAVAGLNSELKAEIRQLRAETHHQYHDLVESISDGETHLLKAFYDFAVSNQKRMTEPER